VKSSRAGAAAATKKQKTTKKSVKQGWMQKKNKRGKWQNRFITLSIEGALSSLQYFKSPESNAQLG
jgi:hypothetical protein